MNNSSICILVLFTFSLVLNQSQAQDRPQDYLFAHNKVRAALRIRPLTWDNKAAAYAQNYANQRASDCALVHSNGPYGENILTASFNMPGSDAVKNWVDERAFYDYKSNSCAPGKDCGHYTQVVWRDSAGLGCAKVNCRGGGVFITCNYNPPGNFVGERPY